MVEKLLLAAIKNQDTKEVDRLLMIDPPAIDGKDENGLPFLFVAAKLGDYDTVKYMVEYSRASMNLVDEKHRTVLHYASMSGNVELCKYLVERVGMSITEGDMDLLTPFEIAWQGAKGSVTREATEQEGVKKEDVKQEDARNTWGSLLGYYEEQVGARFEDMYKNPIRTGFFPDPSIVRVGDDYYMVNSSFIYFPCIPISHSKDLVHWEIIGHAITNPEWAGLEELEGGRGYWAPDISYDNGTFYITATYRHNDVKAADFLPEEEGGAAGGPLRNDRPTYRRQMVVSATNPAGPYSKPAFIEEDGIDPSIFHENGRHYMLLNRGARIFELNEDCTKKISEASLLFYGDYKRAPEGPHLLKKDGYYYLLEAEGGTGPGHRVTVSRSKELFGRYEPCPYNPIMRQLDEAAPLQRTGHGKLVSTPDGRWYMVYLCGRKLEVPGEEGAQQSGVPSTVTILGRETALDPVTWTPDGWPIVNQLQGPSTLQIKPFPKGKLEEDDESQEECTGSQTGKSECTNSHFRSSDFVTPRAPEEGAVVIAVDGFHIRGSKAPLNQVAARNIVLRRQTGFSFEAEAVLELKGLTLAEGQQAGLICYYDEHSWVSLYLTKNEAGNLAFAVTENIGQQLITHELESADGKLMEQILNPIQEKQETWAPDSKLIFKVETEGLKRSFSVWMEGQPLGFLVLPKVYYLSDEGVRLGKRFTGAMVGMYGYRGDGELQLWFSDFCYRRMR